MGRVISFAASSALIERLNILRHVLSDMGYGSLARSTSSIARLAMNVLFYLALYRREELREILREMRSAGIAEAW